MLQSVASGDKKEKSNVKKLGAVMGEINGNERSAYNKLIRWQVYYY